MTDLHCLGNFLFSTDNSHKLIALNFPKKTPLLVSAVLATDIALNEHNDETDMGLFISHYTNLYN